VDESRSVSPGPAAPTGRVSRALRILRPVAVGLAVVAAVAAVIVWLPLDTDVEADVKTALTGYETARQVAWPPSRPIALPLTVAQQAALAAEVQRDLSLYAAGDALAAFDARRAVQAFAEETALKTPWVVTEWGGEVVYFDFVRQTLRGEVIVRAGVRRSHQAGRMDQELQRIVSRRWVKADGADIFEYMLRDVDGAWKVIATEHWGVCGPQGQDVVEGGGSS